MHHFIFQVQERSLKFYKLQSIQMEMDRTLLVSSLVLAPPLSGALWALYESFNN